MSSEWIPCEQGLPTPYKSVLVSFEHTKYASLEPMRVTTVGIGFYANGKWSQAINAMKAYKDSKITAWMPLPEPYGVDKNEG